MQAALDASATGVARVWSARPTLIGAVKQVWRPVHSRGNQHKERAKERANLTLNVLTEPQISAFLSWKAECDTLVLPWEDGCSSPPLGRRT
jgi:hypothetical protein